MQRLFELQKALRPVLTPLGLAYSGIMAVRRAFYEKGGFARWSPPAPCVAVGNIGWGGTGKTPLCGWLLNWAAGRSLRAVLLTRGYGARPKAYPYLVPPAGLAEEAGDEPLLLAREHPGAAVVVDPQRTRGGKFAAEKLAPKLFLLDDGFQHLAVERDMNLVLLRAEDLGDQWNRVLPAGSWREGAGALSRAQAFLLKVGPRTFGRLEKPLTERLGPLGKPVFSFTLSPTAVRRVTDGERRTGFEGAPYLLVSGVGNPGQVERTATAFLGRTPDRHLIFGDHHFYTKRDAARIRLEAQARGCAHVLCTPKDAVKLGPMADEDFWTLDLEVRFGSSLFTPARFDEWWDRRWDTLVLRQAERQTREERRRAMQAQGGGHGPQETDE